MNVLIPDFVLLSGDGSRDQDEEEAEMSRSEVTSLAEELGMIAAGSSRDGGRSLLPAQDSCEVDSLPEDRGKPGVLVCISIALLSLLPRKKVQSCLIIIIFFTLGRYVHEWI